MVLGLLSGVSLHREMDQWLFIPLLIHRFLAMSQVAGNPTEMVLWGHSAHWVSQTSYLCGAKQVSVSLNGAKSVWLLFIPRAGPCHDQTVGLIQQCRPSDVTRMGSGGIRMSFLRLFHLLQGLVHHFMSVLMMMSTDPSRVVVTTEGLWSILPSLWLLQVPSVLALEESVPEAHFEGL